MKQSPRKDVFIETSQPCCLSCFVTLSECGLGEGRGVSNRIFKTALPSNCPYSIAVATVDKMKVHLKDRFERSLTVMKKRVKHGRSLSPTTSDRSGPDDDFDDYPLVQLRGPEDWCN